MCQKGPKLTLSLLAENMTENCYFRPLPLQLLIKYIKEHIHCLRVLVSFKFIEENYVD